MSDQDEDKTDDQNDDAGSDRTDDDAEGQDQLGDAGKKALDAMKAERNAAKKEAREAKAELAKVKAAKPAEAKPDDKPDADEIRKQAKAEASAEVLRERALDKVEAKAAKLFADPEDARALLAASVEDFVDGDKVDLDAINDALADLLKRKPHLAATGGQRFTGSADGGARKGSGKPAQLTAQDLKRMTPQQIVDAQEKGQFADLLGT